MAGRGPLMSAPESSLQAHYESEGLLKRILAALEAEGKDLAALTPRDLSPVDEFHTRGILATRDLAALADPASGARVLDVGAGLGGPARFLAATYDCNVTGLDLVPGFCEAANELSRRTGLADRTRFQAGNALELPFADATFDLVWTFQVQMNIADKARFYGEIARVLRPGGRLAFQDIFAGDGRPLDFPVPWASDAANSHLVAPDDVRELLRNLGLRVRAWHDVSAETLEWSDAHSPSPGAPLPELGTHLVMGEGYAHKRRHTTQALRDGRIVFIQGVYERTP